MDFFVQGVNVLKILVTAIGAGLGAWGVINLMEGYGNDNPGAKSQGIKHLITSYRWNKKTISNFIVFIYHQIMINFRRYFVNCENILQKDVMKWRKRNR